MYQNYRFLPHNTDFQAFYNYTNLDHFLYNSSIWNPYGEFYRDKLFPMNMNFKP